MTKAELIMDVRKRSGMKDLTLTDTNQIINILFDTMCRVIKKEGRFSYPGLGTFTVKRRAARKGRNPRTGAEIKIKASKSVGFRPAPAFKQSL